MEVAVDGMDAVVEPSGMSSWRVTGMKVLNCDTLYSLNIRYVSVAIW